MGKDPSEAPVEPTSLEDGEYSTARRALRQASWASVFYLVRVVLFPSPSFYCINMTPLQITTDILGPFNVP
jgi:hypothetical protein